MAERGTARVERADAAGAMPVALTDVAPLGGRLLAFFSDARVPHEARHLPSPFHLCVCCDVWPLCAARLASAAALG